LEYIIKDICRLFFFPSFLDDIFQRSDLSTFTSTVACCLSFRSDFGPNGRILFSADFLWGEAEYSQHRAAGTFQDTHNPFPWQSLPFGSHSISLRRLYASFTNALFMVFHGEFSDGFSLLITGLKIIPSSQISSEISFMFWILVPKQSVPGENHILM
jgi:hypothetical protein